VTCEIVWEWGKWTQEAYSLIMVCQNQSRKVERALLQWVTTNNGKLPFWFRWRTWKITAYKQDSNICQQDSAELNEATKNKRKTTVFWDVILFSLVQAYQHHLCPALPLPEDHNLVQIISYHTTFSVNQWFSKCVWWANPPPLPRPAYRWLCTIILN
jgi:hypothetical protein